MTENKQDSSPTSDNVQYVNHEQARTSEGHLLYWTGTRVPMSIASYRAGRRVYERNPSHQCADAHNLLMPPISPSQPNTTPLHPIAHATEENKG